MITIDYVTAFIIYLFAWLLTLAILWAREIWRLKNYDWTLSSKERLCHCDNCHFAFLIKHGENITRCPRCNEMCIMRKRRGI